MIHLPKLLLCTAALLLASAAFAQTYDLPLIVVNTKGKELSKGADKIPGEMRIVDNGSNTLSDSSKAEKIDVGIKIRGQTSADFPKKGYSVELHDPSGQDTSLKVLGMPKNADWVFHGPYVDKTLIRNALAHWLYQRTGRYSSRFKFFELYLNGQYKGVYVLLEKIKRAKARVHIAKLKDEDISGDELTGGYVLSIDKVENNSTSGLDKEGFKSKDGSPVVMRSPKKENTTKEQQDYIKNFFNKIESTCDNGDVNSNGCSDILDIDAAVDYIMHEDVTNNTDAYICSFYMFKDKDSKGGKLQLGAPWDFNLGFGAYQRVGGEKAEGWRIPQSAKGGSGDWFVAKWVQNLWNNDGFQKKYKERWKELRSGVWHTKNIDHFIDSLKTVLKKAADRNFERWPNLGQASGTCDADPMDSNGGNNGGNNGNPWGGGMWGGGMGGFCMGMKMNYYNEPTWDAEIEHLRKYVKQRFSWIDQQVGFTEPSAPVVTEPLIIDDWTYYDKVAEEDDPGSSVSNPPPSALNSYLSISRLNFYKLDGRLMTVQSEKGGMLKLLDYNGHVIFLKRIRAGVESVQLPRSLVDKTWITTLNGKLLSR
jgi:hypothetical protein